MELPKLTVCDTSLDGATWKYCNRGMWWEWHNLGADWIDAVGTAQGAVPYIRDTSMVAWKPHTLELDATSLVRDWMQHGNTGLLLRGSGRDSLIASRRNTTEPVPVLIVDGVECPCTASLQIAPSAGNPMVDTGSMHASPACLMRFDLSGITTLTKATLRIRVVSIYSAGTWPVIYEIFRLNMPSFTTDPAREIGGVLPLGDQSAIISRDDPAQMTDNEIKARFLVTDPVSVGGTERTADGMLRCWADTTNPRIVSWWKVFQPLKPTKPDNTWRRDYVFGEQRGYEHMYMQYEMRIGEDVRAGFNEGGMKLPGPEGAYNLSGSGERTLPVPTDRYWSRRLWHTAPSDAYPHLYRLATYAYEEGIPLTETAGFGRNIFMNKMNVLLRAEQRYTIETFIQMNSLVPFVNPDGTSGWSADPNGIFRVWVDGVLVHEELDRIFRRHPSRQVHTGFNNYYHGGTKAPKARLHYDLGPIIFSTQYIGIQPKETNMPIETLITKGKDLLDSIYAEAGQPSLVDQLTQAQTDLATANAENASLNTQLDAANTTVLALRDKVTRLSALVDDAIQADTVADQQEAARLAAIKAEVAA